MASKLICNCYRSEMAQKIGANELAESVMAFNTNYSDAGLFGVYAVAKVRSLTGLWLKFHACFVALPKDVFEC